MPFSVWHSVADRVDWSNKTIQFCGEHGDPMMHPDIEKFILSGVEMAWRVQVNTNGGIRTPEWYDEIYNKEDDVKLSSIPKIENNQVLPGSSQPQDLGSISYSR